MFAFTWMVIRMDKERKETKEKAFSMFIQQTLEEKHVR